MATTSDNYQWQIRAHDTSNSILPNTSPPAFDSIDIRTHFNILLQISSHHTIFCTADHSQFCLRRDLISSSDESIRASAVREGLITAMPHAESWYFIDNMVADILLYIFLMQNQRLLSIDLVVNHTVNEREWMEMFLSQSMDGSLGFKPASKSCIDGLKRVRVRVEDDKELAEDCTICLEKHSIGDEVIWLPCKHVFHGDCILEWLQTSHLCPLCRFSMSSED